jgi:tRNA (cytidine/uridine-2'-O-)-methyltransferase
MEVTLYQPQIPQNVGSVARTCAATGIKLNLIKPFPFELSDRAVKRAGLDYWHLVRLEIFDSWQEYWGKMNCCRHWVIETYGSKSLFSVRFCPQDVLIFGRETTGVCQEVLQCVSKDSIVFIPVLKNTVRSLNLSNCVTLAVYESLRQFNFKGF